MSPFTKGQKVSVSGMDFEVGELFAQGEVCDLYSCTYSTKKVAKHETIYDALLDDDDDRPALIKVVRDRMDADFVSREIKNLAALWPGGPEDAFLRFLPQVLASDEPRSLIVMPHYQGYVTLAQVSESFPGGLDFQDLAWMFKRLMSALGFAHSRGYVHGAVYPPHVLVHPTEHGARVLDWTYSVKIGQNIPAYAYDWDDFCAPEIRCKANAGPSTDIYMAGKCAIAILGGNVRTNAFPDKVPKEVRDFLLRCVDPAPADRPQDAWQLHEDFDAVLKKLVGKPKYRKLVLPRTGDPGDSPSGA